MDRPDNGIMIMPKIFQFENGSLVTMVRRLIFVDSFLVGKDLLLPDGKWTDVPNGGKFPKEVFIKSVFLDCVDSGRKLYNWPR